MDWVSEHRLLGDRNSFKHVFKAPIEAGQNRNASPEARLYAQSLANELRSLIFSMTLRREKNDILNKSSEFNLGKKTEIVLWW